MSSTNTNSAGWARPLRLHLSIVIVILLLGVALPLMWLTYEQGTRSAVEAAGQQMRVLSQHAVERYRTVFGQGLTAVTIASADDTFLSEPPADLGAKTNLLLKLLAVSPYIDGIYAGYSTGAFVHAVNLSAAWKETLSAPEEAVFAARLIEGTGEARQSTWRFYDADQQLIGQQTLGDPSYNPTARPWFKAASRGGVAVAVGPYVMATTKLLGLTIATPMESNQNIVVGADVILEAISRLLSSEAVSAHAVGYVFDERKRLIVHSDPEVMKRVLAGLGAADGSDAKIEDPVLDAVRVLLDTAATTEHAITFKVGGRPYLAYMATTGNSDLVKRNTVVIAAPISDFTSASVDLLRKALVIAATLLVIGILLALLVANLVSRSLLSLAADAEQIGNLEFDEESKTHSYVVEINTLEGALGSARDAIRTFALYVPRELVRRIVASGQAVANSAARQEVTIIFTDIRDFTTISERHSPEEVVSLLSDYFQVMNEIVESHNGVIVQYLGDSIYAMWNAPTPDPDHVDDGCRCALALKAGVDQYNERNRARGLPELITRYGVHTGPAVVGSVGALTRRQYTAMGDTVNVASQLEGLNKEFGTTILASEAVKARADKSFEFRPLGLTRAKGRAEQVEVFELVQRYSDNEVG